jgi:hypothetical protein
MPNNSFEVHWATLSEVITFGSPNRDIQCATSVRAHVSVDVFGPARESVHNGE